jgi:hypothetical protein
MKAKVADMDALIRMDTMDIGKKMVLVRYIDHRVYVNPAGMCIKWLAYTRGGQLHVHADGLISV